MLIQILKFLFTFLFINSSLSLAEPLSIKGTPLAIIGSELWYLDAKSIYAYDFNSNKNELVKENLNIILSTLYNCSNYYAFMSISTSELSGSYKVFWEKPLRFEEVDNIYSGDVETFKCSLDKTFSRKIEKLARKEKFRFDGYLKRPVMSRNWGKSSYFFSETTNNFDKSSSYWPLKVMWLDSDGKILSIKKLPSGPWVWWHTIIDSIKNFSCGTSCYTRHTVFSSNDEVYAVAYGEAVPKKGRGIFKLVNDSWRLIKKGNYGRSLVVSDDGRVLAISDLSKENLISIINLF